MKINDPEVLNNPCTYSRSKPIVILRNHKILSNSSTRIFTNDNIKVKDPEDDYAETSITLSVKDLGSFELPAVVAKQTLYLSVAELFNYLQIKNKISSEMDSISGFFPKPIDQFMIGKKSSSISYQNKTFRLSSEDIIVTPNDFYLKSSVFGKVFGLNIEFNFRSLSAELKTKIELPALREMRLEQMRQSINRLKGTPKADSTIGAVRPKFHFGMAEWGIASSTQVNGPKDTKVTLGFGSVIAGGETNIGLYYHNTERLSEKQQFYQWRYANNENELVKQVLIGKIPVAPIASIYNPVVGAQVTNAPTIFRKSYGTYPTSGFTEPNWVVELFVNNELVDYKKADASGFYTFDIPLVFGNSSIQLRFYGPFGEERSKELTISIPFNFLPFHEMQYVISSGIVEDSIHSRYFKSSIGYGLNRSATIGAGVEYLSSVTSGKTMPFVNASVRLTSNLIFSGDYTYGVRSRGILDYRLPSNLLVELNYTNYVPGQTAISFNYREERKLIFSMPYHTNHFTIFSRLSIDQIILPSTKFVMADYLISAGMGHFSTNITNYAALYQGTTPYYYGNYAVSYRFRNGLMITPSAQYEYRQKDFLTARMDVEKHLFKNGYLNISVEDNFKSKIYNTLIGLRYQFGFAQTSSNLRRTGNANYVEEAANGSFIYDRKEHIERIYDRPVVGRSAMAISCFLDLNGNGKRDKNEPRVDGLKIRMNSGTITYSLKDTAYRIYDLEPYVVYHTELEAGFQSISYQLKIHSLNVMADPNQIKEVEIPVLVRAEVSGTVSYMKNGELKGLGRMIIGFFNSKNRLCARTMTEADGTYTYLGLMPGKYTVHIDGEQMRRLGVLATPEFQIISIGLSKEGDLISKIDFIVKGGNKTFRVLQDGPDGKESEKEIHSGEVVDVQEKKDIIAIQTISFGSPEMAQRARMRIQRALHKPVMLFYEGNYFKLRITGLNGKEDANKVRSQLGRLGFYGIIFPASSKFKPAKPL